MNLNVDFPIHVAAIFSGLLSWIVIGVLAYRLYKRQSRKLKVWKVFIVIFIGIFSFSINFFMFDTMLRISILPLGVWILYFVLKRKEERWQAYRSFAWLGFFSNFIFLTAAFITIPVQQAIYPENKLATYISTFDHASIVHIHPSAKHDALNKAELKRQMHLFKEDTFFIKEWYDTLYFDTEPSEREERFPYQLIETAPKWGSGLKTIIFIEDDGKGILISTPRKQLYFRSEISVLEEGK